MVRWSNRISFWQFFFVVKWREWMKAKICLFSVIIDIDVQKQHGKIQFTYVGWRKFHKFMHELLIFRLHNTHHRVIVFSLKKVIFNYFLIVTSLALSTTQFTYVISWWKNIFEVSLEPYGLMENNCIFLMHNNYARMTVDLISLPCGLAFGRCSLTSVRRSAHVDETSRSVTQGNCRSGLKVFKS